PFRIRAYRNAARTIGELSTETYVLVEKNEDLTRFPGIGHDLSAKIKEIVSTGHCSLLDRLHTELPPAVTELLKVPGLGPKRVRHLYHDLDVQTVEQLYCAARDGCIRTLPGFGENTELNILQTVETHADQVRPKLAVAAQYAEALRSHLAGVPGVIRVTVAGSFRRMRETVGDLDIIVAATPDSAVMQHFIAYDEVAETLAVGATRASVILKCGIQVDLRVVAEESYGAALHYFTGSKAHNIAVRQIAQKRGLKINEYGVYRGETRIAGESEESVYHAAGLSYIPPELRENRGEIAMARIGPLPRLVEFSDLRGDLHAHTKFTNGHNTLREMALAGQSLGLEYLAITDHSRSLTVARGLDPRRLARQCMEIEVLNEELEGITLLKGIEVDILEDGSLDLPDHVLAQLDLVVGAVHSKFELSRARQTERILRAMAHPHFTMLAHPTGRIIQERAPCDIDMPRIIREAGRRGCFLELNSQPGRLDLLDIYCQMAKEEGVLVSINSGAHSTFEFDNLRFGIGQARRGWLENKMYSIPAPSASFVHSSIGQCRQRRPTLYLLPVCCKDYS
ncbi:MAG: DNA polymerase/3'-5' exonuclease PolX, partial [Nitrosospira sp.]